MNLPSEGRTDGRTNGRANGQISGWMDGHARFGLTHSNQYIYRVCAVCHAFFCRLHTSVYVAIHVPCIYKLYEDEDGQIHTETTVDNGKIEKVV